MVLFRPLVLQTSKDQTKFTMDTDEVKITKWQLNWLNCQQILQPKKQHFGEGGDENVKGHKREKESWEENREDTEQVTCRRGS